MVTPPTTGPHPALVSLPRAIPRSRPLWTPTTTPTTLDAQRQGRVLYITGDINPTIEGLSITGGNAAGLGGFPKFEGRLSHLCLITLAISPDLW